MSPLKEINILVTLDENYLPHLNVMLSSLIRFNPDCVFNIYLLHTSIGADMLVPTETIYNMTERLYQMHAPFEAGLDLDWVSRNSVIIVNADVKL